MSRFVAFALTVMCLLASSLSAAVFQIALPIEKEKGETTAFLWIPPKADQVRGILHTGTTLAEKQLVQDPHIRQVCEEQELAIVHLTSGLESVDTQELLDKLAEKSGYQELSIAPLFFVGHSAGGPQARNKAIEFADRCFGLMLYRGGTPADGKPVPAGIPSIVMMGQYDEFFGMMRDEQGKESWQRVVEVVAKYRAAEENNLVSLAVEPGAGHFTWSQRNSKVFALFLAKAAEARIPEKWDINSDSPPKLKSIDPKSGWLTDLDIHKDETHAPAKYDDYKGDKTRASWHFDKELAEALVEFHQGLKRKDQFLKWNDRYWVDAGVRHFFLGMTWVDDGSTFEVHPVYRDEYPPNQKNGQGPRWADAGKPASHSNAPIKVKVVGGPIRAIGDHKFQMAYDELNPPGERSRITFLAYSPGDETYRWTEVVGMAPRGFKGLNKGKAQTITFESLPDEVKADADPIELKASSDADLPVRFYVARGPAKVVDGKLQFTELPKRMKTPVEVEVVAYQFGSGVKPEVQSANPVSQTVRVK